MNDIQKIMFGELRPWLAANMQADVNYKPLTRQLNSVQTLFNPHYNLNFIRRFSDKTQYYQKIIDNCVTDYCNIFVQETKTATPNRLAYHINKATKDLHKRIINVGNIINTQQFDLSVIVAQKANFSIDKAHKESTYIFYYLLSSLIKCCLEIQHLCRVSIKEEDVWEIADFYTCLLQQQTPINVFITEIQEITIRPQPQTEITQPIENDITTLTVQDNYTRFMQEVQPYQFAELPKYKCLSAKNQMRLVRLIVGKGTPYAIAMLHFLEYPQRLNAAYSLSKEKQYKHIAKCLAAVERSVKGNLLVLNPNSNEDRLKYTAAENEQTVKDNYFSLTNKIL